MFKAQAFLCSSLIPPLMSVSSPLCPPALRPGCQTHVISPPGLPSALEKHKRLLWRYQQPLWLTSTLPSLLFALLSTRPPLLPSSQRSILNYHLHLICSLNTKLLSASHFPYTSTHLHQRSVRVCNHYWFSILFLVCFRTMETSPLSLSVSA